MYVNVYVMQADSLRQLDSIWGLLPGSGTLPLWSNGLSRKMHFQII